MNILIIPSWYRNAHNPIKGSFFREQALMFQKRGHQVAVLFVELHSPLDIISKTIERSIDNGMITYILHTYSYGFGRFTSLFKIFLKRKYQQLFDIALSELKHIDVIHAHSFFPAGIISVELGKKYGIPVVTTEHSSKVHTKSYSQREKEYLRRTINESDSFICVSNSLKDSILECIPNVEIRVIPNSLTDSFYYNKKTSKRTFSFICVGNLIDSKRQELLMQCFKEAFTYERVKLIVAGDGVLREKLIRRSIDMGINNKVKFLGIVNREDMPDLLNKCNVFVLVSTNETFGVSYIEALACGCPVIATKNGGAEELVNESNGILVEVDSKTEIINALKYIYHNYNKFNCMRISKDCIKKYNESNIYREILDVYSSVIIKR